MSRVVPLSPRPERRAPSRPTQRRLCPECARPMAPLAEGVDLVAGDWWQCPRQHRWLTRHGLIVRRGL